MTNIRTVLAIASVLVATASCKRSKHEGERSAMKPAEPGARRTATPPPPTPTPTPAPATVREPAKPPLLVGEALASKYIACVALINSDNFDAFQRDCVATEYRGHEMAGMELNNPAALVGMLKDMKAGVPDLKLEPQLVLVSGRNILAVVLTSGKHTGTLKLPDGKEIKKTDKRVGQLLFHRLAIDDDNKASEEWAYSDHAAMPGQLGLLPRTAAIRPIATRWPGAPIIAIAVDDAKERVHVELMNQATAAFQTHKVADVAALWADDGIESDQAEPSDRKGKQRIENGLTQLFTAFPDAKCQVSNTWAAGDYVVALGTFTGTQSGPLGPIKATNRPVTVEYAEVAKIKDGKVTQLWRFRDAMAMMAAPKPQP